jgi:hypothetical protein
MNNYSYLLRPCKRALDERYVTTLCPASSTARMKLESLYTKAGMLVLDDSHPYVLASSPCNLYVETCDRENISKGLTLWAECNRLGLFRKL